MALKHIRKYMFVALILLVVKYNIIDVSWDKKSSTGNILRSNCINREEETTYYIYHKKLTVSDCSFAHFHKIGGNGGAILADSPFVPFINITDSVFFDCTSSNYGGAIYFETDEIHIDRVCGFQCSASYHHFAYFSIGTKALINELSLAACSNYSKGSCSMSVLYYEHVLTNINNSKCVSEHVSGIKVMANLNNKHSLVFCTFSDNNVTNGICVHLNSAFGNWSFINFVSNNSPNNYGVVYSQSGPFYISSAVFYSNQNTLFYSPGMLILSYCYISHLEEISFGNVTLSNNNTFSATSTYGFSLYNTFNCQGVEPTLDITPKQTPPQTPSQTPSQTQSDQSKPGSTPKYLPYFIGFGIFVVIVVLFLSCKKNNTTYSNITQVTIT